MNSSMISPRTVTVEDAASFLGIAPTEILRYHEIGLLPEPPLGGEGRRYRYDDMIRLLWIRAMADAVIADDDIRLAFAEPPTAGGSARHTVASILDLGLLSDVVTSRLVALPEGSLRLTDLDTLLVTERIFGPLGAAIQATRFIALATHHELREESVRVDAAENALDDTVTIDDPRVEQVAAERHAFERMLNAVIEDSGLAKSDEALFDSWDALGLAAEALDPLSAMDAVAKMPYDFSPARWRAMELAEARG